MLTLVTLTMLTLVKNVYAATRTYIYMGNVKWDNKFSVSYEIKNIDILSPEYSTSWYLHKKN